MKNHLYESGKRQVVYWAAVVCVCLASFVEVNALFAQNPRQGKSLFVAETAKQGTTFYGLAEKYYGNRVFWIYIYLANRPGIPYPTSIKPGMSVVIPQAETLGIDAADPESVSKAKELAIETERIGYTPNEEEVYSIENQGDEGLVEIVKPGDTFRTLALKHYGSKEFWVYIYLANKSKMPHPSKLNIGTAVAIPPASLLAIDASDPSSVAKAIELGRKAMAGAD